MLLAPPDESLYLGSTLVSLGEEVAQLRDARETRRRRAWLGPKVRVGARGVGLG